MNPELNPARRKFLKLAAATSATVALGGLGFGYAEYERVEVSRVEVKLATLPAQFDGLTIAHLSDIHHGIYTGFEYISHCVEIANSLKPDIIALTGDYTLLSKKYIEPCADALKPLRAAAGVFAVLGNHDYYQSAGQTAHALRQAGFTVLIDGRERLEKRGAKISLLGADDLLYGHWNVARLLGSVPADETRIVLAHNPDYIGKVAERGQYADFVMSGHTHGGQVRFPLIGAPHVISDYGQRYVIGLNRVEDKHTGKGPMQIYTTRGIGAIWMPVRFDCPPEIALYTLRQA
ncbi:MAG TPA: metallophosphoesterase [Blastocatellia bacterium]|nr:metallophosphoesterase [Blastocatellia bacterium]